MSSWSFKKTSMTGSRQISQKEFTKNKEKLPKTSKSNIKTPIIAETKLSMTTSEQLQQRGNLSDVFSNKERVSKLHSL